jgi:nitrogen regulatory protein PII
MQTVTRKKIEILADGPLMPRVVAALAEAGIHGHTVVPALSGSGRTGQWSEERLTGAETKQLLWSIASAERADALVQAIAPLLTSHRLLLAITDVEVVRGDRF